MGFNVTKAIRSIVFTLLISLSASICIFHLLCSSCRMVLSCHFNFLFFLQIQRAVFFLQYIMYELLACMHKFDPRFKMELKSNASVPTTERGWSRVSALFMRPCGSASSWGWHSCLIIRMKENIFSKSKKLRILKLS